MKYSTGFRRAIFFSFFLVSSSSVFSRETDPYMASTYQLRDSLDLLHQYMLKNMGEGLRKINEKPNRAKMECLDVSKEMMLEFRQMAYQKIEDWADHDPEIDRAPSREEMSDIEYIKNSYYSQSPFNVPLTRTLNVGGIYIGSDKLGHFTSWGLRYLAQYRNTLSAGKTQDEAIRAAVHMGYNSEYSMLGIWATGVASYGDMEANYQGMKFNLDLCKAQSSFRLALNEEGNWELLGNLDMRKYVNLDWDEFFNPSIFSKKLGDNIFSKNILRYCPLLKNDQINAKYREKMESYTPSYNRQIIRELDQKKFGREIQKEYSLSAFCLKMAK